MTAGRTRVHKDGLIIGIVLIAVGAFMVGVVVGWIGWVL